MRDVDQYEDRRLSLTAKPLLLDHKLDSITALQFVLTCHLKISLFSLTLVNHLLADLKVVLKLLTGEEHIAGGADAEKGLLQLCLFQIIKPLLVCMIRLNVDYEGGFVEKQFFAQATEMILVARVSSFAMFIQVISRVVNEIAGLASVDDDTVHILLGSSKQGRDVSFSMNHKVGFEGCGVGALQTFVGPVTLVHVPVLCELFLVSKCFLAILTSKSSLLSVAGDVVLEVTSLEVFVATNMADVGAVSSVRFLVLLQVAFAFKLLVTNTACKFSSISMCFNVSI